MPHSRGPVKIALACTMKRTVCFREIFITLSCRVLGRLFCFAYVLPLTGTGHPLDGIYKSQDKTLQNSQNNSCNNLQQLSTESNSGCVFVIARVYIIRGKDFAEASFPSQQRTEVAGCSLPSSAGVRETSVGQGDVTKRSHWSSCSVLFSFESFVCNESLSSLQLVFGILFATRGSWYRY